MKKNTRELLHQLEQSDNIEKYLDENENEMICETPQAYLMRMLETKGLKAAEVASLSNQGDYIYKVLQGKRKASRDIMLAIAVGMALTPPQAQLLLRVSQLAQLDPRNSRDSIIIYGLNRSLGVNSVNDILFDLKEQTL